MDGKTGLVFATKIESHDFIKNYDLKISEKKPFKIFTNNKLLLIISGIGKANAAMAASYLIYKYATKIIINIGAAGSTVTINKIGDIFQISKVIEYDRPGLISKKIRILKPDFWQGFACATLATQDKPVIDNSHRQEISKYAELVDMEGAAVIQACRLWEARCYLFKFVTDTAGDRDMDIIKNILSTRKIMFDFFTNKLITKL